MNLIETIERKRKEYRDRQEQSDMGTLVGLREIMKKRQMAALQQPQPKKEEVSNAK
jgi:hypothetical protein